MVGAFDLHARDASECQKSLSEKWPLDRDHRKLVHALSLQTHLLKEAVYEQIYVKMI